MYILMYKCNSIFYKDSTVKDFLKNNFSIS